MKKNNNVKKSSMPYYPEIFNTLENSYSTICVVGNDAYSQDVYTYFKQNRYITVYYSTLEEVEIENDVYKINELVGDDGIIFFGDGIEAKQAKDKGGSVVQTFFLKRFYEPTLKTTECLQDFACHIMPRLLKSGVHVIKVYIPDRERLEGKRLLRQTMLYWKLIRHISNRWYQKARLKKEKKFYLYDEIQALSSSTEKGYSEMFGNGEYINFDNGFRRTVGNHADIEKSIFFFGPCFIRAVETEDAKTIPSLLKNKIGEKANVYNYGAEFQTINYIMRGLDYKKGDIILYFSPETKQNRLYEELDRDIITLDLTDVFNQVDHLYAHIYDLLEHFDDVVAKKIVAALGECLEESGYLDTPADAEITVAFGPEKKRTPRLESIKNAELKNWLTRMKIDYPKRSGTRGAIIMNCNPFTLGHRYLIETASRQVDELFVFVVEEDKSYFPFADRIQLVQEGTNDLKNVVVLPSGQFMISSSTLPGYFKKEELAERKLDASTDLLIFAQIAEQLGITKRFAGEEPIDQFTRQYNENMARVLPKYGIAFVEIPRKENDARVISASWVREALKTQNWSEIANLVPPSTYQYLQGKWRPK